LEEATEGIVVRIDHYRKTDRTKFHSCGGVAKIQRIFDGVVFDIHQAFEHEERKGFLT